MDTRNKKSLDALASVGALLGIHDANTLADVGVFLGQIAEKAYTLAELQALDNDALNALAAELRGFYGHALSVSFYRLDGHHRSVEVCEKSDWHPATDRNQSGELLEWASAQFDGAITKQPILFDITFGRFDRNERLPGIEGYRPEFVQQGYEERMEWAGSTEWLVRVPGNDARAETVAFCAAMLAMAGRLK